MSLMDKRVLAILTPEKCEVFAKNASERGREDLAKQAIARAVELRAESHGASTSAEKEALQAIYAYEETLRVKNGKKTHASRTWQMIDRHGIIEAVNRAVARPTETQGYNMLVSMGLEDYAFESVILRHPDVFSTEAVEKSKNRAKEREAKRINS